MSTPLAKVAPSRLAPGVSTGSYEIKTKKTLEYNEDDGRYVVVSVGTQYFNNENNYTTSSSNSSLSFVQLQSFLNLITVLMHLENQPLASDLSSNLSSIQASAVSSTTVTTSTIACSVGSYQTIESVTMCFEDCASGYDENSGDPTGSCNQCTAGTYL